MLLLLWFLMPAYPYPIPSLMVMLLASAGSAGYYYGVRFLSYWVVWAWVTRRHPSIGGIHPAARGELPRNAYLLTLLSPILAFVPLCGGLLAGGAGILPEICMAIAVAAAVSVRDLRAAMSLLSVDSSRWVKETARGMDILKLIDTV